MERQKTDTRWIVWTAVLTLLLGVPTISDLLTNDASRIAVVASRAELRRPASLGPTITPHAILPSVDETLVNWNCKDNTFPDKVQMSGTQFRLKGQGCGVDAGAHITLVNESNGFTASVFSVKNGFETDLIQLSSGENRLRLISTVKQKRPQDPPQDFVWTVFSSPKSLK